MTTPPDPPMQFGRVPTAVIFSGKLAACLILAAHADESGQFRTEPTPALRALQ